MEPVTTSSVPGVVASSDRISRSIRAASSRVNTRTSTVARLSGATMFVRKPPSIVPTLTVTPRSASLRANRRWMSMESSRIALAPF